MNHTYSRDNRIGDHIWWIGDVSKFKSHYPDGVFRYNREDVLVQIHDAMIARTRS